MRNSQTETLSLYIIFIFMICVPIVFFISSLQLEGGAEIMPLGTSIIVGICGVLGLIQRRKKAHQIVKKDFPLKKFLAFVSLAFIFILLTPLLGFYVMSWLTMTLSYLLISEKTNTKNIIRAIITASIFTVCTWIIFYKMLTIITPTGLFI